MAGQITAIEPQARHTNRFNLYVDHHFVMGLSAIVAAKLRVGQRVSDEELAALEQAEAYETAHERALRFLETRPRSTSEVKTHLRKKQIAAAVIAQVTARLTEAGLLDDAAFAQYWVENRETFRPRAARALRFELKRKGLKDDVIAESLGDIDENESAYRAAESKVRRWQALDYQEFIEKLGAFLVRRGFSYAVARSTAKRWWTETHP